MAGVAADDFADCSDRWRNGLIMVSELPLQISPFSMGKPAINQGKHFLGEIAIGIYRPYRSIEFVD